MFPKEWDLDSLIREKKTEYKPDNPRSHGCIEIGIFEYGSHTLEEESKILLDQLEEVQHRMKSKKKEGDQNKNHHTPTWML